MKFSKDDSKSSRKSAALIFKRWYVELKSGHRLGEIVGRVCQTIDKDKVAHVIVRLKRLNGLLAEHMDNNRDYNLLDLKENVFGILERDVRRVCAVPMAVNVLSSFSGTSSFRRKKAWRSNRPHGTMDSADCWCRDTLCAGVYLYVLMR